MTGPIDLRDLAPGDAGWVIMRHAELYRDSDGFDASFKALVTRILADFLKTRTPPVDRAWIATDRQGRRLGCVFCRRLDAQTAQLRLFLVEPRARGLGLGQRLCSALEDHARTCGLSRIVLWTHEDHRKACALYARNGFTLTSAEPGRNFGRDVVVCHYEKSLA